MPSIVNLKAAGLTTSPNNLELPDGSLGKAANIVIRRDNVIEPRRGFKVYGDTFGSSSDRAKQLIAYRARILAHYQDKLIFDNGSGVWSTFAGSYTEPEAGIRIKHIEANGNLYFTTSDGVKKISAKTADQLSTADGFITQAGGIKALDLTGQLHVELGSKSSFLTQDGAVAYRVLWNTKDNNDILIQGTPSQRLEIYNPLQGLLIRDFNNLLSKLDILSQRTGSLINDGNYISSLFLPIDSSDAQIRTNLISLAEKIDKDILIANDSGSAVLDLTGAGGNYSLTSNVVTITFESGNPSLIVPATTKIYIDGFTAPGNAFNGAQTVLTSDNTSLSFSFTGANYGATVNPGSGLIQYGAFRAITQPAVPSIPSTDAELVALQDYFDSILTELKNLTTETLIADDPGTTFLNIDAAACSVAAGVATITFSSGDPRVYLRTGQSIDLSGFTPVSGTVNGIRVVTGLTATTLTFTTTAGNGAITVAADALINKVIYLTEADSVAYIQPIETTTSATVDLDITIPQGVTLNYFYQIYRSPVAVATGAASFSDIVPSDELQLVYEAYPTQSDIDSGHVLIQDQTPSEFAGANLYTNPQSGDGILSANDVPPLAKDINRFKSVIFYANTTTRHRRQLNLLGVSKLIADFNLSIVPTITIANSTVSNTYKFVVGVQEVSRVTTTVASSLTASGAGDYFFLNSANDLNKYYVWYNVEGGNTDPAVSGRTGIQVYVLAADTAAQVASKTAAYIGAVSEDFTATTGTPTTADVTITNNDFGDCANISDQTTPFTFSTVTPGAGEKVSAQQTDITVVAGSAYVSAGTSDYFTLNSAFDRNQYYVWFKKSASTDPALANKIGIQINIGGGETASAVATLVKAAIPSAHFSTLGTGATFSLYNVGYGPSTSVTEVVSDAGFTVSTITVGALDVLLSDLASPARAVDETMRSFVRMVNRNPSDLTYAFYLSSSTSVPGQALFEARVLGIDPFYVVANNSNTGSSFNPDVSPEVVISTISTGSAATMVITTSTAHGLVSGNKIIIDGSNSTPNIDGVWTVTVLSPTTLRIGSPITVSGTAGALINTTNASTSENEQKQNRIYYSKFQQPEAVPLLNYLDVGSEDQPILRIFPLRDSLFVFKTDGLYRISGETSPWVLSLFDNSCILIADDSVDVCNNELYGWTTQGIIKLSEAGVGGAISRVIDTEILKLGSSNYTNFRTSTWGIGYQSDNSYIVWTVSKTDDVRATIAYRYNNLTNSWTTITKSNTCGIINPPNDRLYLGAGDINNAEIERKSFTRLDYADRQYDSTLGQNSLLGNTFILSDVDNIEIGDSIVQEQFLSIYEFNMLLKKLDTDGLLSDSNYFSILKMVPGGSLNTNLDLLITKISLDSGRLAQPGATLAATYTAISPTSVAFSDMRSNFNDLINLLNADLGVGFSNYMLNVNDTIQEAVVFGVNKFSKTITLNLTLEYIQGAFTIYKAIQSEFQYSPITMQDALSDKQLYESTIMFANKAFTRATATYSSDLIPSEASVDFLGDGNGIFGHQNFGEHFFGGGSNGAPFRTLVPRNMIRCRYLLFGMRHSVAREKYEVYGATVTGNVAISTRAYR